MCWRTIRYSHVLCIESVISVKTTPADRLPNLLPQNFDKSLLKLV